MVLDYTQMKFNQTLAINNDNKCSTECLLRINFLEQSTSFRTCIQDNSSNALKVPYIQITNNFLSNTSNTGSIAINFQNNNYWFDSIYLTKPGFISFDYIISGLYEKGILDSCANILDISASTLLIVCKNEANNYLTIVQSVLNRTSIQSSTPATTLTNIINNISSNLIANNNVNFKDAASCGTAELTISTININNLIPMNNTYFYYSNNPNNHYIIMPGDRPIILETNTIKKLNNFFSNNLNTNKREVSNFTTIPSFSSGTNIVFVSSVNPSKGLLEGEDDIYISCQPTNQEGTILVSDSSVGSKEDPSTLQNILSFNLQDGTYNSAFSNGILGIIIMLIIIKGGEFILKNTSKLF